MLGLLGSSTPLVIKVEVECDELNMKSGHRVSYNSDLGQTVFFHRESHMLTSIRKASAQ